MTNRWTVDYEADYGLVMAVYEALYPQAPCFGPEAIPDLVDHRPELADLNAQHAGVNWYPNHPGQLRTITPDQTQRETARVSYEFS